MIAAVGRHLLQSTVWAFLLIPVIFCFRNRGAASRHALWFLAAAKFAVAIGLLVSLGASVHNLSPFSRLPSVLPQDFSLLPSSGEPEPSLFNAHAGSLIALTLIWLGGTVTMLVFWLRRLFIIRGSMTSIADLERGAFNRMKQRLRLRRDIHLRMSSSPAAPFLSGFWRPTVAIPEGLSSQLSPDELESVILHELAHAMRWDNWSSAFVHFLVCVFWFHPLLWWIERRLIAERELACDELVLSTGAVPEDYAAGILKVCRLQFADVIPGILGMANSNLKHRMEAIMSFSRERCITRLPKTFLGLLATSMIVIPLAIGLLAVNNVYGRSDHNRKASFAQDKSDTQPTCVFSDVKYPQGTVIQVGAGPEQMCVRTLNGPQWVHATKEIRDRAQTVVSLPEPAPFVCRPEPSPTLGFCSCEKAKLFSQNAIVLSRKGSRLRCDKGKWVFATAQWIRPRS